MKIKNKKGMEFAWIFAIIVGAMILFLAFYFIGHQVLSNKTSQGTEEVHGLDILFNPFSYLGAMGAVTSKPIELPRASNLEFDCDTNGLGSDAIIVDSGLTRNIYDKYIFSENFNAKKIQTISMPFTMPWRVADLIFVFPSDKEYCFTNMPAELQNELELLNYSNFYFDIYDCHENATRVCFSPHGEQCDIHVVSPVDYTEGYVLKNGQKLYFVGRDYSLLLGAIFSRDKDYYDCNVKRLAIRIGMEIQVYNEKQKALLEKGCSTTFGLDNLKTMAKNIQTSKDVNENDLNDLKTAAENIENLNYNSGCSLF